MIHANNLRTIWQQGKRGGMIRIFENTVTLELMVDISKQQSEAKCGAVFTINFPYKNSWSSPGLCKDFVLLSISCHLRPCVSQKKVESDCTSWHKSKREQLSALMIASVCKLNRNWNMTSFLIHSLSSSLWISSLLSIPYQLEFNTTAYQ